tara:strand:- start:365 stop:466 length:102 start_codon:yes stop_codon:yes gene_type:complete
MGVLGLQGKKALGLLFLGLFWPKDRKNDRFLST